MLNGRPLSERPQAVPNVVFWVLAVAKLPGSKRPVADVAAVGRRSRKKTLTRVCVAGSIGGMTGERDPYGNLIDPAEASQHFMLRLFDLADEGDLAGFSPELIARLHEVPVLFVDEYERRFPRYGKGRAIWR